MDSFTGLKLFLPRRCVLTLLLHAIFTFPRGRRALRERERIPRAIVENNPGIERARGVAFNYHSADCRAASSCRIIARSKVARAQISPYLDFTQSSVAENRVARTTD